MWTTERFDAVVVGGGPAAAAVAGSLLEAGRTVAVAGEARPATPAALHRWLPSQFGARARYEGASPAWPFDNGTLAPYYALGEYLCGARPAGQPDRFLEGLATRLRRTGVRPYVPLAGSLRMPAGVHRVAGRVTALALDPLGRDAAALIVERDGRHERIAADVFVLAAGGTETPALLLRSAGGRHPDGLGNAAGAVGRFATRPNRSVLYALAKDGGPASDVPLAFDDFEAGAAGWPHPLGHVTLRDAGLPPLAGSRTLAPGWTETARALAFTYASEATPDAGSRVTLNADGTARLHRLPSDLTTHRKLGAVLRQTLARAGLAHAALPTALASHDDGVVCGTARMARAGAPAVLDTDGMVLGTGNVWVADESAFPSCGAADPTLTAVAYALRVADHVAALFGGVERALAARREAS